MEWHANCTEFDANIEHNRRTQPSTLVQISRFFSKRGRWKTSGSKLEFKFRTSWPAVGVGHLGFARKLILTTYLAPGTHNALVCQISRQSDGSYMRLSYSWFRIFLASFSVAADLQDLLLRSKLTYLYWIRGEELHYRHANILWYRYVAPFRNDGDSKASCVENKHQM